MRTNETRQMLFEHILNYPGVSFQFLKGLFKMSEGNLRYHLNNLEKEKKVTSSLMEKGRCYFPFDQRDMLRPRSVDPRSLSNEEYKVIRQLQGTGDQKFKNLINSTGLSRKQLTNTLRSLKRKSIILSLKEDEVIFYRLATKKNLKSRIERILLIKLAKGDIDEETYLILDEELHK